MQKRTLIIISVAVVIIGLAVFGYFALTSRPSLSVEQNTTLPGSGNTTGNSGNTGTSTTTTGTGNTGPVTGTERLAMIDQGPVVPGEAVVDVQTSSQDVSGSSTPTTSADIETLFIKRESGNVFSYVTSTGEETRTSNRTIPGIQSASWLGSGIVAAVQYLSGDDYSTVNTYLLSADGSDGSFLPQDLAQVAAASSTFLTLASGVNGSVGSVTRADGSQAMQKFTTPLSDLRVGFAGTNQFVAFTKPAAALSGDAFLVDSKGNFSHIAGPLAGLVALPSPSGKWALVSYIDNGNMKLELVNTKTLETISLPVGTIADKCVWTADESTVYCGVPTDQGNTYTYPDDWYAGVAHFSDRIWKIDITGRFAQLTLDFSTETKQSLDAEAMAIDPAGKQLVFVNKNDGSLWRYEL